MLQEQGTSEQQRQFLVPLRDDPQGLMAVGIKEPESGSDHFVPCLDSKAGPKLVCVRDGDHVILNGAKEFISNGAMKGVGMEKLLGMQSSSCIPMGAMTA